MPKTKTTKEKIKAPIVEALKIYAKNPCYQYHIPGHTRGCACFSDFKDLVGNKVLALDTTDEFDNLGTLHPATGPIKEAEELAAKAFGAKRSFFLLNGSTTGNLALAMALTKKGQKVVTNRNCHRSILTGLIISGAEPLWLIPKKLEDWALWGSVSAESVEKFLKEYRNVAAVWITNPTYEGVVSDVKSISDVCKKYNVPLLVDEAHGSLWKFNETLPQSALELGADAVIHSLHKTGGSMSQSSILHISENSILDADEIEKALKLLHTTSPSLLLLASLDAARANLESARGKALIKKSVNNAKYLRRRIDSLQGIEHLKPDFSYKTDVTKIFIKANGLTGKRLEAILEKDFHIEVESASDEGILVLSNIGNSRKDFEYLADALEKISKHDYKEVRCHAVKKVMPMLTPIIKMRLRDAFYSAKETVPKSDAIGRWSAEVIAECPPGITILVPGELITQEHMPYLENYETLEIIS